MPPCASCGAPKAHVKRFETGVYLCRDCFSKAFEDEVYDTIQRYSLINDNDTVVITVSGGKDSTALLHSLYTIRERYHLGFQIHLLCIDEGIAGYRDNALEAVNGNAAKYNIPLTIISFTELFGWTLDQIFRATATKETCTYCGIFRRRAIDLGSIRVGGTKVALGHNEDDIAETVLINVFRGDIARFGRSVDIMTSGVDGSIPPRIKPFAFQNQREIVLYAHFNKLVYYAVECPYAVQAFRRFPREYLVAKQQRDPLAMRRIIEGAIAYQGGIEERPDPNLGRCERCGQVSNKRVCMACNLLEKLRNAHAEQEIREDEA